MKKIFLGLVSATILTSCFKNIYNPPNYGLGNSAIKRQNISRKLGDAPNFAQSANGNLSMVVSRNFGKNAKAGALIEAFYPLYSKDQLESAFNGVYYDGKLFWFHDLKMVNQTLIENSGIINTEFQTKDKKLSFIVKDVVQNNNDSLFRNVEIINKSNTEIKDLRMLFSEHFSINFDGQLDKVQYDDKLGIITHFEKDVYFTIGSNKAPDEWQCGLVNSPTKNNLDSRKDAEDGNLNKNSNSISVSKSGVNSTILHYIDPLTPGNKTSINYIISAGRNKSESINNFNKSVNKDWQSIETEDINYWKNWLAKSRTIGSINNRVKQVFNRALITLKQNTAENGAIMAGPNTLLPFYNYSWPRDGSYSAMAYLASGHFSEARNFLNFILSQQKSDGSWAINYFMDGSRHFWDYGKNNNEVDQIGVVLRAIYEYYQITKDLQFLKINWEKIKRSAEFLTNNLDDRGLIFASRDLWELHTGVSWTYSNAATYGGLMSASKMSKLIGNIDSSKKYSQSASKVKKAIETILWSESGGKFYRGIKNTTDKDTTLESANLGLGYPFLVFPYTDNKLKSTADKIYFGLKQNNHGVRRYVNDKFYDGNSWPVTTNWLAIHYAHQGNRSRAIQLHNIVTNYAFSTKTLMLGEQFDEKDKLWVSSFPFTWSSSNYILATMHIYNNSFRRN